MTLQDLGNIGEFVAAGATIATLIYLALQIRQNTGVIKTSNYADISHKISEFSEILARDAELIELYLKGCQEFDSLTAIEKTRFTMLFSILLHPIRTVFS